MKHPLCLLLLASLFSTASGAADPPAKLSAVTSVDRIYMSSQRRTIDDLARRDLGRQLNGVKHNDLGILQALLDRKLVSAQQTLELQAMGIVMGDLLAVELGLTWIIYEDRYGRSRALQLPGNDNVLFPATSISRRVEVGIQVTVTEIYAKLVAEIRPHMLALPFQ